MSKNTEWLSVTENLIYFLGKRHTNIMKQEQVTLYSNDGTLAGGRGRQDHFFLSNRKILHASFL
jgi:hypothetical protein